MKHNPQVISKAAIHLQAHNDIIFVVMTEGEGANYLKNIKQEKNLSNLILLPFQKFEDLPMIFGSSDVFITILEDDAGIFSVPSKLWSYFCAGKPNILSVPKDNLTALITKNNNAGLISEDKDISKLILTLRNNSELCSNLGNNARAYAENNFYIDKIVDRFIQILK